MSDVIPLDITKGLFGRVMLPQLFCFGVYYIILEDMICLVRLAVKYAPQPIFQA